MNHQDSKAPRGEGTEEIDGIARAVVDAAFKVHSTLGPGLLETVYEACLVHELHRRGLRVETQVALPIEYDGLKLDAALRLDLVVDDQVIIELKAVEALLPIHTAQLMTYLKTLPPTTRSADQLQCPAHQERHPAHHSLKHQDTKTPRSAGAPLVACPAESIVPLVPWCLGGEQS